MSQTKARETLQSGDFYFQDIDLNSFNIVSVQVEKDMSAFVAEYLHLPCQNTVNPAANRHRERLTAEPFDLVASPAAKLIFASQNYVARQLKMHPSSLAEIRCLKSLAMFRPVFNSQWPYMRVSMRTTSPLASEFSVFYTHTNELRKSL